MGIQFLKPSPHRERLRNDSGIDSDRLESCEIWRVRPRRKSECGSAPVEDGVLLPEVGQVEDVVLSETLIAQVGPAVLEKYIGTFKLKIFYKN